ncbi:MAG: hypothetical protein FWE80_10025 [Oscillospiraceae bacterium]|nr:hypothetical protein [Oscillospiraceae bacterium]
MTNTIIIYIALGILTVIPLFLFNIRRIWVRKPPEPPRFNLPRFCVITAICAVIIAFLYTAAETTFRIRFEITTERLARSFCEMIIGESSEEEFYGFVEEHGTEKVRQSLEKLEYPDIARGKNMYFQISEQCIPKYWQNVEGFEQVPVIGEENPLYVMFVLYPEKPVNIDKNKLFYCAARMVKDEDGWKYDWIGNPTEKQLTVIKMPTLLNGKWYGVSL